MSELDKIPYWHCLSVEYFKKEVAGSKGQVYEVEFKRQSHGDYDFDWSCTCLGFKYNGKCKHITTVLKSGEYCGWMQFQHGGEPAVNIYEENVCPKCGGPVAVMLWVV